MEMLMKPLGYYIKNTILGLRNRKQRFLEVKGASCEALVHVCPVLTGFLGFCC